MPARIQITGGPGSGKTTAARRLGAALGLPVFEIDVMWLDLLAEHQPQPDIPACRELIAAKLNALAKEDMWVVDGASVGDAAAIMKRAEVIVHIDVPFRVAGYRIASRHIRAELARNNRWPGWWRMATFWNWSRRWYAGTNESGLNDYGTPRTSATLTEYLAPHRGKVVSCRTLSDLEALFATGGSRVAL